MNARTITLARGLAAQALSKSMACTIQDLRDLLPPKLSTKVRDRSLRKALQHASRTHQRGLAQRVGIAIHSAEIQYESLARTGSWGVVGVVGDRRIPFGTISQTADGEFRAERRDMFSLHPTRDAAGVWLQLQAILSLGG